MIQSLSKVELCNIRYERSGRAILDEVSWRIGHGEHWAVVGANGSGKTTLLQIATGYLWPNDGSVRVLGSTYGQVDLRRLRRQIGWVSASLVGMIRPSQTAMQIILSGAFASTALFDKPTAGHRKRSEELIDRMGCRYLSASPFGVLSLGEQQKVLIARALMARPALLILDEACAGLDIAARENLLETIGHLSENGDGTTLVFVTHHIEEIPPSFTHALVLKGGRVLTQGPKQGVLTGEVLSRAFDLPIAVDCLHGRFWPRVGPLKRQ